MYDNIFYIPDGIDTEGAHLKTIFSFKDKNKNTVIPNRGDLINLFFYNEKPNTDGLYGKYRVTEVIHEHLMCPAKESMYYDIYIYLKKEK